MAKELKELTKRAENYSQWYNDLVMKADLAEQAPVRGCMIIKPYGYALWEKIQSIMDKKFKDRLLLIVIAALLFAAVLNIDKAGKLLNYIFTLLL